MRFIRGFKIQIHESLENLNEDISNSDTPQSTRSATMKKICLIMSALNEGEEPLKTAQSIRQTSPKDEVDLLIINDGTKANDFQNGWVDIPDERVIHHQSRMGRPLSMEEGVNEANTEYIGLLNAKMKFYPGWYEKVLTALESSPKNIIFQTTALLLNAEREIVKSEHDNGKRYGAHVHFLRNKEILKAFFYKIPQNKKIYDIPGLLGANYFTTKRWYKKIKGWEGLYDYGGMDVFLALKSWVLGGKCQLIKDAEIGNVYRKWQYQDKNGCSIKPYTDNIVSYYYNKIFIGFVLLDLKDAFTLFDSLKEIAPHYQKPVQRMLLQHADYIKKYREYIKTHAVDNVYDFINKDSRLR